MINHYFFIRRFAKELKALICHGLVTQVYSPSRNEIVFLFEKNGNQSTLKINFDTDLSLPLFINEVSGLPRQYEKQFTQIWGFNIIDIVWFEGERLIRLDFENDFQIWIRFFGNQGNVFLTDSNGYQIGIFNRRIRNDYNNERHIYKKETEFIYVLKEAIHNSSVWWERFIKNQPAFKELPLETLNILLENRPFSTSSDNLPVFSNSQEGNTAIEVANEVYRNYLSNWLFIREKNQLLQPIQERLKRLLNKLKDHEKRRLELSDSKRFEHLGNLLIANAHAFNFGTEKLKVLDYLTNTEIEIKVEPALNAFENANKYFKKAKNQVIEYQQCLNLSEITRFELNTLKHQLEAINTCQSLRELRKYASKNAKMEVFPFKRIEIEGFEVWLGKNAKQNDELLRTVHKDDIWLHARNYSGSHVVIRTAGRKVPQPVLERAASWAAWMSKGKTEQWCSVMYTLRKFVRKPKGAATGAVLVEKESTILVQPSPLPTS